MPKVLAATPQTIAAIRKMSHIPVVMNSRGLQHVTAGGAATPVIYDGTVSSGVYTADYANGDIHRITAPSGTLSVSTSNIPLGYALIMRVNNAAGATVYHDGAEVVESTETGVYLLTFANLSGVYALYSKMTEA